MYRSKLVSVLPIMTLLFIGCLNALAQDTNTGTSATQLLEEAHADLDSARQAGEADYAEAVRQWILLVEDWIESSLGDPGMAMVLPELARLYRIDGDPARAFRIYRLVVESERVSVSLRAMSVNDAIFAGIRGFVPAEDLLALTDLFLAIVEENPDQIEAEIPWMLEQARDIDLFRAKFLADAGLLYVQKSQAESSQSAMSKTARMAGPLYRQSAEYMRKFMNGIDRHRSDIEFSGGTSRIISHLLLQGRINNSGAQVYERAGDKSKARPFYLESVRVLEQLFREPLYETIMQDRPQFTQDASVLLLTAKMEVSDSINAYLAYAYQLAEKVAPVSESLAGFVETQGMDLTLEALTIGKETEEGKLLLDAANALFQLAMKLDEEYRPDGFKELPNYQSAVLFAAENSARLKDYDQVEYYLGMLEGVRISGPITSETQARLKKELERVAAKEAAADLPVESEIPEKLEIREEITSPTPMEGGLATSLQNQPEPESVSGAVVSEDDRTNASGSNVWWWLSGLGGLVVLLAGIFLIVRRTG